MKDLQNILASTVTIKTSGLADWQINAIQFDSRKVVKNDVFVALKGVQSDGHDFIQQAIDKGAGVIVVEKWFDNLPNNILQIQVQDSH